MGKHVGKNAKMYVGQLPKVVADGQQVTCTAFQVESGPDIWESVDGEFGSVVCDTKPFPMARQVQQAYSKVSIRFISRHPPKAIKVVFYGKTYDRIMSQSAEKRRWKDQWECEAVLSVSA